MQQGLNLEQMNPGSSAYHIAGAVRLRGELQPEGIDQSLRAIIARHESLRASFVQLEGQARQQVPRRRGRSPATRC